MVMDDVQTQGNGESVGHCITSARGNACQIKSSRLFSSGY
jgi:hypothetical protein